MNARVISAVHVGRYALEVGTDSGSFARFESRRENQNAPALTSAFAEERDRAPTLVEEVERFEEDATAVTDRIEQTHELYRAAAEGRLLEGDVLLSEIDGLIGLLERLDRAGRFEEELRLARALHGLLVLTSRWLDLLRTLRRALQAAQKVNDKAGQAWALHELGSLRLCAGDPRAAARAFEEALQIQERLQGAGWCATRHNLDSARRDSPPPGGRLTRRLLRFGGLVAAVAVLGGSGIATPGISEPRISLPLVSLDLGRVAVGNAGRDHFPVTNAGATPVTVTRVESDRPEFQVETNCLRVLQPREQCEVHVRFEPRDVGPLSAKIRIGADGLRPPPVRVFGTGLAVGDAAVDPDGLDLGGVPVGSQSAPQSVTVTAGQEPLIVSRAVADSPEFGVENGCDTTIGPKARCSISVRFRPAETGPRRATLTISRARGEPFTVALAGLGTAGEGTAGRLAVSPTHVNFSALRVGEKSAPRTVRVTNVGESALSVQTAFSTATGHFGLADGCRGSLWPAKTCGLEVTFSPEAAGAFAAALTIKGGPGKPFNLDLTGTGVGVTAKPTLAPSLHDFGTVEVLTNSEPFSFTLTAGSDTFEPQVHLTGAKDFTLGNRCEAQLAASRFCTLDVSFTPAASGQREATLTVRGKDGERLTAALTGVGQVVPPRLTPAAHDFGVVDVGRREGPFSFTLAAGSEALDFRTLLGATKDFRPGGNCTGRLEPHANCSVEVTFAPTGGGARRATLLVAATEGPDLESAVTGTGNVRPPVVGPKALDFGKIFVGRSSAAKTFTVTAGSFAVEPRPATGSKDFAVSNSDCAGKLAPFAACTFDVVFTPNAFGVRSANVRLGSLGPRVTAAVSGYGWASAKWWLEPRKRRLTIESGTPTKVTLTVSRGSLAPLLLYSGISLSGSNFFQESSDCPPVVQVDSSCTITITFTPTRGLDDTNRRATLTISTRNSGKKNVSLYGGPGLE